MVARIFKTSKTAMQSGTGNADQWFLEFDKNDHKPIDQVMNWIGSTDTTSQIRLKFETKEIFNDGTNAGIAVRIEAQDNQAYTYMWSLEKIQDDGPLKNNWMTTGVSGPRLLAEGS